LQEEEGQWEEEGAWIMVLLAGWLSSPQEGEPGLELREVEAMAAAFFSQVFLQASSSLYGRRQPQATTTLLSCLRASVRHTHLLPIFKGVAVRAVTADAPDYLRQVAKHCQRFSLAVASSMSTGQRSALTFLENLITSLETVPSEVLYQLIGGDDLLKALVTNGGLRVVLAPHDGKQQTKEEVALSYIRVVTFLLSCQSSTSFSTVTKEDVSAFIPRLMMGYQASFSERDLSTVRLLALMKR